MDIEKLVAENKEFIREDESRKAQALEQFREWLSKHPFITNARTDDTYLVHFLRTKKYSMDDVFKVFENNLLFRTSKPEWFETTDQFLETFRELAKAGAGYMLRKRAADGSSVFVINLERLDVDKYKTKDAFAFVFNSLHAYMENEQNQILGCTFILNYVKCPLKVIGSFSIRDTVGFTESASKSAGRFKKYIIVGLPATANALLNAGKKVMTEKQRSRLFLCNDLEELSEHVDKSVLTEYLGGAEPEAEVIDNFVKVVEANFDKVKEINKFEVDMEKAAACRNLDESIGSFRTLEID
ncbi:alpha-tocopherol transfer protein-like [Chironomus tepperi]|uniref:alpha-tocopherol transfer protein-like n=1 Tax=Chironomus tepperi TaxID=113505 RepID=UPI00391F9FEB